MKQLEKMTKKELIDEIRRRPVEVEFKVEHSDPEAFGTNVVSAFVRSERISVTMKYPMNGETTMVTLPLVCLSEPPMIEFMPIPTPPLT